MVTSTTTKPDAKSDAMTQPTAQEENVQEEAQTQERRRGGDRRAAGSKTRVVIVDGHTLFRRGVRQILELENDIEVVGEAGSGREALATVEELTPDVVLMDLGLPDIDGVGATRMLAEHEWTAAIPVVAMSASSLEGREDWLKQNGFAGSIDKPIRVGAFPEQVRRYCADGTT